MTMIMLFSAFAWAGDGLSVGLGVQGQPQERSVAGARLLVQQRWGPLAVEGTLFGSPFPLEASAFDELLVTVAYQRGGALEQPVLTDRVALGALASWAPGRTASGGPWLQGGPSVFAGFEARLQETAALDAGEEGALILTPGARRVVAGPVLGFGFELELGERAAARLALGDHVGVATAPIELPSRTVEGRAIEHAPTLTFDLLFTALRRSP